MKNPGQQWAQAGIHDLTSRLDRTPLKISCRMERAKIGFVVGLSAEARLLRRFGVQVGIGGGFPAGAARAAEKLVAEGAIALVSFGLAGGLNPALPPGAVLLPESVIDDGEIYACDPSLVEWLGGTNAKFIMSAKRVAETAADKTSLFEATCAQAIDLESGAVARVAAAAKIPFAVLRAVADPARRNLPPAALIALNGAGEIGFLSVLGSVLLQPAQIPALLALAQDAAKARHALIAELQKIMPA
jgi:adenosylhomocysteine nucleosidase